MTSICSLAFAADAGNSVILGDIEIARLQTASVVSNKEKTPPSDVSPNSRKVVCPFLCYRFELPPNRSSDWGGLVCRGSALTSASQSLRRLASRTGVCCSATNHAQETTRLYGANSIDNAGGEEPHSLTVTAIIRWRFKVSIAGGA